jgi:hypothetical protein
MHAKLVAVLELCKLVDTENGPAVVQKWCDDLGHDKFAKASCNGLWHFLGTENGPTAHLLCKQQTARKRQEQNC